MKKPLFPGLFGLLLLVLAACGSSATATPESTAQEQPTATSAASAATSGGENFEFQLVGINRTLRTFQLMEEFAQRVMDRTNGQVEIELTSYPELGISGFDSLRTIEDGSVPFQEVYAGFVGADLPFLEMGELFGLFPDTETQIQVLKALEEEEARAVRANFGGEVLFYNYYPWQYFFSKGPLDELSDFDGMQIRTHSAPLGDLIAGLGADPQAMAFAEVYAALDRGIVDAAVTGSTSGFGQKWHEVTDYVVGPIEARLHSLITMSSSEWNLLPAEFQQIIKEEGQRHSRDNLALVAGWDQEGVDLLVEAGMTYSEFTPDMKAAIQRAVLETIVPNWVARVGGAGTEAVEVFNRIVAPIVGLSVNADDSVVRR